jgi:hypothetical protein
MSQRVLFQQASAFAALCLGLLTVGCADQQPEKMAKCLKSNSYNRFGTGIYVDHEFWVDKERSREMTVRQALAELSASLADGKVVDAAGKELYFYEVQDYHHKRDPNPQRTEEEIEDLRKQGYHVIRMYDRPPKD